MKIFVVSAVLVGSLWACGDSHAAQAPVLQAGGKSATRDPKTRDPKTQDPKTQDPKKLLEEALAQFKQEGIELDFANKTLTIKAVVNEPQDPIEYLLIHRKGKRHEAMFFTLSKPSVLNGALLMLGLQRGKNATVTEVDPMPTLEEVEAGAETVVVTPPAGKPYWMTVKWTEPEGRAVEYCVEDLLLDLTTQEPVVECTWVYLGGRMAKIYKNDPPVYVADYEGNLVSICYMLPDNHLATMVHEGARDDQNWWLTDKVPEPGSEVQFVFHMQKTKLHIARQLRLAAARKKDAVEGTDGKDGK